MWGPSAPAAALRAALARRGHAVDVVRSPAQVAARAGRRRAFVFIDLGAHPEDGFDLIQELSDLDEPPQAIAVVPVSGLATALSAVRQGASDYLTVPVRDGELDHVLARADERERLARRAQANAVLAHRPPVFPDLVGRSSATRAIQGFVRKAARAQLPVMLAGETGTGKDLVARLIHDAGPRAHAPFVTLNCAGLTSDLHTAQLFGYEKGSFTGAAERHQGIFEAADGGTLFLDEIDALHPAAQAGLLRAIESGEVRRVGAAATIRVNVRVVVATTADLARAVEKGSFRKDLFYRVGGLTFRVPSLRERAADVPALAQYFLARLRGGRRALAFSRQALSALSAHAWPGNVRELRNLVERLVLTVSGDRIEAADVRSHLAAVRPAGEDPVGETLESVEKGHIERILARYRGNKTHAARALGISLRNLYQKIDRYGLGKAVETFRKS